MNQYSIYWIKEEFAHHFFHKSHILYRFLTAYQMEENREDLTKQFEFITNSFPKNKLISHLSHIKSDNVHVRWENNNVEIWKDMQYISLHIHQKHINFRSEILHDAENLLFPALRLFQPVLFIMSNNVDHYGWLSPVIQRKKDKTEQVLYSYL
ncbi:sporulation inhibitor of replication protein SirA [Virgibacillus siamensis]|uniref:Sporulation inhibitor of replication protein SirA n=1 Tax=Virgibacillus siamensis TaxID=480071 RepID=A0ABN1GHR5_9BACI